ncbi:MAG: hypothetical protein NTY09_09955 [bacterium]|nr:hypothetical protein [bacterium]
MNRNYFCLCGVMVILLCVIGCTKGGESPVAPEPVQQVSSDTSAINDLCIGLYDIEFDPATQEFDVIPLRGPQFQLNLVLLLQPPAGNPSNFGLVFHPAESDVPNGLLNLDINLTHPYPGTDLRTFDLRLVFMGDKGTSLSDFDYGIQFPKPTETRLINADGYTRWWNATEFLTPKLFGYVQPWIANGNPKATLNGFKYYSDDLGADDPFEPDITTRGTWSTQTATGDPNTLSRRHIIQFEMAGGTPVYKFSYAVLTSFEVPTPPYTTPAPVDAFPLNANSPEIYKISIEMDPSSTAYYTSVQSGGDLVLNIDVFDWQAMENPGGVEAEIGDFVIESPTLWTGPLSVFDIGAVVGSTNETSSIWKIEIQDVTPTDTFQDVLVTVESASPTSYAPFIPGAGIYPGGATLSAYNLVTLELPGNSPPTIGEISGPSMYSDGIQLEYTLSSMSDLQDGPNLTVQWDFNGDGVFMDDEDGSITNKKGKYTFVGTSTYTVQCRVTDTALDYTDSNVITVEPVALPYVDPMDTSTKALWTIANGLFGIHSPSPPLEWNVQTDHWSTSKSSTGQYTDYMDTTLISPIIPAGDADTLMMALTHRWETEYYDKCRILYRINGGVWLNAATDLYETNPGYPAFETDYYQLTGFSPGNTFEVAFHFNSDSYTSYYAGWDISDLMIVDNAPPEVTEIIGPTSVNLLGPWTYTVTATDPDGIGSVMWSVEESGNPPVYDEAGDPLNDGEVDLYFPADGTFEVWVKVFDAADPPFSATFGYLEVTVAAINPEAFFKDHFDTDTGDWVYTGGIADGAYQDFWHIVTASSYMTNVGADGYYAEHLTIPNEKTTSVDVAFPSGGGETRMKIIHQLGTESGGGTAPYDGQWVTLDGQIIDPSYGFLYSDGSGTWAHGYFVGYTVGFESSTFYLGTDWSDGGTHTLAFHSLSSDTSSNNLPGWQVDYVEVWEVE